MSNLCATFAGRNSTNGMPIIGFTIILLFLVLGEFLSALTGNHMPGSVLGMILMFLALYFKLIRPEWIRKSSEFLTKNMTVLFIPSAIGIIDQWGIIKADLVSWIVIMFGCWFLVFAATGWTHQLVANIKRKKKEQL